MAPALVCWLGNELCAALQCAHSAPGGGILHRDVSPSNVLLSRQGEIKLADFGLAKATVSLVETTQGVVKGKCAYMAPEYVEHGEYDSPCDFFSLGVLMYETLVGRRPYDGPNELETLRRAAAGDHTPVHRLVPELPASIASAMRRCSSRRRSLCRPA